MAISARLDELKRKFDENPRRYFAPLANEYRKQGDTTQAIALCRTHLPNQPGHISGHIVLAQALYESRELAESRQIFEAALELDPENIIALRYLGDIAREQGSPSAAQAWYKRVLEFDPRNEEIAQLLADVKPEAEVELAELASRPTPAITEATALQPEAELHEEPLAQASAPEAAAVEEAPEFETMELAPPEAATGSGYDMPESGVLDAPAAPEMVEEPLDLYDADPTGDAWRESIAEEAGDARPSGQAANLAFSAELPAQSAPPPAAAEPSFDDWFAQPAPSQAAASQEPEFEEFAPDLAAATPATPEVESAGPGAAADAIEDFTWSFTESEGSSQPAVSEPEEPVEASTSEEPEMEFSSWGATDSEASPSAPEPAESARNEDAWAHPSLSTSDAEAAPAEQPGVPDESVAAWTEASSSASAQDDGVEAAFEAEARVEGAYEEEPYAPESPYGMSELRDDTPAGVSADTDAGDVLPGIDSLGASVDDDAGSFADLPEESEADDAIAASMASSDPLIGRTPSFVPAISEESSAAFVTETMAELYMQQGFTDEALSIYRQLLARNPGDRTLAERVRALEGGAGSAVVGEDRQAAHPSPDSESARSFFARFANRTPRGGGEGNAADRRGDSAQGATVPLGGAAMPDEALTRPDEPTLTHMFSDRQVPAGDTQAARTLASAFGATPDATPGRGGELSLQQLFRDVPARSSGAVTLGEHGTDASQGSAGSTGAPDPDVEAPADYEQFTAWLEGLKKK